MVPNMSKARDIVGKVVFGIVVFLKWEQAFVVNTVKLVHDKR